MLSRSVRKGLLATIAAVLAVVIISEMMIQTSFDVFCMRETMTYNKQSDPSFPEYCSIFSLVLSTDLEKTDHMHGFKWIVDSATNEVLIATTTDDMSTDPLRVLQCHVSHSIALPFPCYTLPAEEILKQEWTGEMQEFLRSCSKSSPVAVVVANYPYRDVIINWLVAARVKLDPPLENVLVISFDSLLQELMQRVGIKSIQVPPDSLASHYCMCAVDDYYKLLMARVTVLRLINYWGYDVAHYDTDAIILKNPQPLYNKHADSDVIGSTGRWPFELGEEWGFTLCMGTILFRSTPQTELFWNEVSKFSPGCRDDQVKMNYALINRNVTWDTDDISVQEVCGEGANEFKVTALSQSQVCRMRQCKKQNVDQYYVWHKGGVKSRESKIRTSSVIGSWYLKEDWENITRDTTARGVEWLREISVQSV